MKIPLLKPPDCWMDVFISIMSNASWQRTGCQKKRKISSRVSKTENPDSTQPAKRRERSHLVFPKQRTDPSRRQRLHDSRSIRFCQPKRSWWSHCWNFRIAEWMYSYPSRPKHKHLPKKCTRTQKGQILLNLPKEEKDQENCAHFVLRTNFKNYKEWNLKPATPENAWQKSVALVADCEWMATRDWRKWLHINLPNFPRIPAIGCKLSEP